jgi:hypothetical protein
LSTPEQAVSPDSGWREVDIKVEGLGRKVFAADSMLSRLQAKIRRMVMSPAPDRGPSDFAQEEDERILLPVHLVERLMKHNGGGYHEGGDKHVKAVIVGCTIALLSAFVIGAWKVSNDQAAFVAEVKEWQKSIERRLDALERRP